MRNSIKVAFSTYLILNVNGVNSTLSKTMPEGYNGSPLSTCVLVIMLEVSRF